MTNRQSRRAVQSETAKLPTIPNISGTGEACGNCAFSPPPERAAAVVRVLAQHELAAGRSAPQPLPEGDVWCLADPQQVGKRTFGWCSRWKART